GRRTGLVEPHVLVERVDDRQRRRTEIRRVDEAEISRQQEARSHLLPELFVRRTRRRRKRCVREAELTKRRGCFGEGALGEERGRTGQREETSEVAAG